MDDVHRDLKFYEFFAGGGMVRAGLGESWDCLFANDICTKKAAAYEDNWGSGSFFLKDIAKVRTNDVPGIADLAWASFPCQDLSLAGAGAGLNGDRSGTFWRFWGLMERLRTKGRSPSVIVLENVYGAITSNRGRDFKSIINVLARRHRVGGMVIDAIRFVPQSRPRLFIVAVDHTIDIDSSLTSSIPSAYWHPRALLEVFHSLDSSVQKRWIWWNLQVPNVELKSLEDIVEREPTGVTWHSNEETRRILSMMSPLNRKKVSEVQSDGRRHVGTIYRRTREGRQRAEVRFDGISGCLRTPSGGSSRQSIVVVEGAEIRTRLLSAREAARLMGLSENYRLPDSYNEGYHLAGDGVVVPVVSHLSKYLLTPLAVGNQKAQRLAA